MTIIVIGHITQDTLIFPGENWHIVNDLGGTLYTVSALASLTDKPVRLICNVGDNIFDAVISALEKFPNIDVSGIKKVEGSHFHCYIMFVSEYGTQYDEGTEIPITFAQLSPFLDDSEFIIVSPMTGFDLELHTLQRIKQVADCPVYLDYHILALDRDSLGNRFLRRRKNWLDWCTSCDHLQLNQFEAESLSKFPINTIDDAKQFSKAILLKGVKSVAITLGSRGGYICWRENNQTIHAEKISAIPVTNVVDTTGCGDVFVSGFAIQYLKTGDCKKSYEFANKVAGLKCGFSGFDSLADALFSGAVS